MKRLAISVNGGGALGIGPAYVLTRLEQDLGKSMCSITHAYAGTSTGSIIAACLNEGINGHEIFELYKEHMKKIFTKYPWYKRVNPKCPTYDNSYLKSLLKDRLHGKCSEWFKPIFIPTTFMNGDSEEKVWDKGDATTDKWLAVLSSTAAPTYFDTVKDGSNCYCDGGMWANDPTMTLVAGLKNSGWEDFKVISFNTGFETPHNESGNKTLVDWAAYIMEDWVARSGNANYYEAKSVIGESNIFRCSPKVTKNYKMDDTSEKTIQEIIDVWDSWYEENKESLIGFIK